MDRLLSKKLIRTVAGYGLAAVCLFWVLRNTDLKTLVKHVSAINWMWAALGILMSYVSQGLRWLLLLKPTGRISVWRTTQDGRLMGSAAGTARTSLLFNQCAAG